MASPFRSALAKLDDSVQNLDYKLGCLRAGQDVADDQLWEALSGVNQSSAELRHLIRMQRPDAAWKDRSTLETLIQQLEWEAQAKRDEERRARLFDLAGELDAGTIKHRFESRVAALNSLRLQAVRELRIAGTLFEQDKELPGPPASEWMHWACNLREETDAAVFADLRRDFPALERFAGEMEENYWLPGERTHDPVHDLAPVSNDRQWAPQAPAPSSPTDAPDNISRGTNLQFAPVVPSSKHAPGPPPNHSEILVADLPASLGTHVLNNVNERSNGNGSIGEVNTSSTVKMWTVPAHPQTVTEAIEQTTDETPTAPAHATEDLLPTFGAVGEAKKPVALWIAAGIVVLGAIFGGAYYFSSGSGKASEAVSHTASKTTGTPASENTPSMDADTGSSARGSAGVGAAATVAGIQPIEGAQHQILLNMESCRRSNVGNVECQGYVTNLSNQPSHVTLGGVDVVDGKGNSFNLTGNGQFNFSSGRSQNIAAGSRAKYMVSVPDKDRDARTLTVYVDVNNPSGLEFTFRNVPIAE